MADISNTKVKNLTLGTDVLTGTASDLTTAITNGAGSKITTELGNGGSIKGAIDAAISGLGTAVSYIGDADQNPSTTDVTTVNNETPVTVKAGDVCSYNNKEYICTAVTGSGTKKQTWRELGDEAAYVVKQANAPAAKTTQKLYKITTDSQGLIASIDEAAKSDIPGMSDKVEKNSDIDANSDDALKVVNVDTKGLVTSATTISNVVPQSTKGLYVIKWDKYGRILEGTAATANDIPGLSDKVSKATGLSFEVTDNTSLKDIANMLAQVVAAIGGTGVQLQS